jgi:sensor histidine kinase regulating citrate/malate metabolism
MEQTTPKIQKTVPKHGLGLKIVHSIAESCEGLVDTEQSEDRYRIRVALPML